MVADLLFTLFATVLVMAALGVVSARNPVYSILFMILAFFNASGLFLLLGAEFLALILIMVYVGAIAVMFLFVVMTIDVEEKPAHARYSKMAPMGLLVAGILLVELIGSAWGGMYPLVRENLQTSASQVENTVQLGDVLFTRFVLPFQSAGIILLIAMVGAIVLTHRRRGDAKHQNISKQIARTVNDSMVLTQPDVAEGVTASHFVGKGVE